MRRQRNMIQTKEQDKTSEKELNKAEINSVPDKEFKVMNIKMLNELWRIMDKHSENFNRVRKYKRKQTELKTTITEIKNTLEEINSRLDDTEEQIRDLENRILKITQAEQKEEKRILKNEDSLRNIWDKNKGINIHIIRVQKENREIKWQRIYVKKL